MTAFFAALWRWVRPYRPRLALVTAMLLLELGFENGLPLSLKYLIDDGIVPRNAGHVALILGILIVAALVYAAAAIVDDRVYAALAVRVLNDIRREMFEHLQRLPVTTFQRLRSGDVGSRFSGDVDSVETALLVSVPTTALSVLGLLVSFVILFVLQWELALVAAFGLVLAGLTPRPLSGRAGQAEYEMRNGESELGDAINESIAGQMVVKAFGLQRSSVEAFDRRLESLRPISVRASFLGYLIERTPNLSVVAVQLAVLWFGALLTIHGSMSVGGLVSFNGIFLAVSQSVYGITVSLPDLVGGAAGYRRIREILDEEVEDDDAPQAAPLQPLRESLQLRDVDFAHTPDHPVLRAVSLTIPRGAFVAVVGASGSGKSTLINLLLRFQDPTAGTILLDGRDLREIARASLRQRVGVVLQDTFLFDTTIAENVRLARPGATDDEVQEACRLAGVHDHISVLRDGYQTVAGERGGRLSGGQRQRIAIARAMLRHPELLILDEATTSLDPAAEAEVNATLRAAARGRTTVAATHRLATVTHADMIVMLDHGRVVEQGSHAQLLAADGPYRALWNKQSSIVVRTEPAYEIDLRLLRDLPLLGTLAEAPLEEVASLLTSSRHETGETIFIEGDRGDALYFVARGSVEVIRAGRHVATLQEGDHFGEIALISARRRTATARAATPTILLGLARGDFLALLQRHPDVAAAVDELAGQRLAMLTELDGEDLDQGPGPGPGRGAGAAAAAAAQQS